MKKYISILCALLFSTGIFAVDSIIINQNLVLAELDNFKTNNESLSLDGYILNESKLILITEYLSFEDTLFLKESIESDGDVLHLSNSIESAILYSFCSNNFISQLIIDSNFKVDVEVIIKGGDRYMIRRLDSCENL